MSKYGPAWVWFATGQSLGQVTPTQKRLSATVSCLNPCHTSRTATLSLAIRIGTACGLGLDKAKVDVNALKS